MVRRPTLYEPRLWLKWSVLLISWTLSALILIIILGNNNELSLPYPDIAIGPEFRPDLSYPQKNQIGAFNYRRWDLKDNYRPICSVRFEDLCPENNNLGLFKTALHKVVKIQDLELRFYRYSSHKITAATTPDILPVTDDMTTDTTALIKEIMRRLTTPADGWRINIDLGNVSEARINNFDYRVFLDDDLFFAIQSKRAVVSYEYSDDIVLHGHVKITIADGSTLESNYIKWDVKKQHFSVNGVYVLNRGGVITTGKGICVDAQLKSVEGKYAKSERKEQICVTKL